MLMSAMSHPVKKKKGSHVKLKTAHYIPARVYRNKHIHSWVMFASLQQRPENNSSFLGYLWSFL